MSKFLLGKVEVVPVTEHTDAGDVDVWREDCDGIVPWAVWTFSKQLKNRDDILAVFRFYDQGNATSGSFIPLET